MKITCRLSRTLWAIALTLAVLMAGACGGGSQANTNTNTAGEPLAPGLCLSVTYEAPSGAANNIVYAFDKPYRCGQFANGDWWVSEDTGGSVTITSITPAASGGVNGFEVNPASNTKQAFDYRANVTYDESMMPALPLRLAGVSSVVKSVGKVGAIGRGPLKFVAVLTVVEEPIFNSEEVFRPGYFGTLKTYYNTSQIRSASLPKYAATGLSTVSAFPIENVVTRYRHVQMDHHFYWLGGSTHPEDNMPGDANYGAAIARDNAASLLRLLLDDFNYSNPAHKQALVNYLQMSIDLQGMAAQGMKWFADGGHPHGRKLPLVFGAWAFESQAFTDAIAAVGGEFGEDNTLWRSPVTGDALFGAAATDVQYWSTTRGLGGSRVARDPYGYIDGGGFEVGSAYQFCCTAMPWKHTVLAIYMLGLESAWGADGLLIEYVERWVSHGAKTLPDLAAPYDGVPANYGVTYGPSSSPPGFIVGPGRWPALDGLGKNDGFYASPFANELWDWYKARP